MDKVTLAIRAIIGELHIELAAKNVALTEVREENEKLKVEIQTLKDKAIPVTQQPEA